MGIKEKVKGFPSTPGVYLFKDMDGQVLYVGKAVSLRKRVSSYFKDNLISPRLEALVAHAADIGYIQTANEAEALLLEAALIKSRQPKYNVSLRDDKSYPLLKLTVNERFPRLFITRIKRNDGALYFGPYTSAKLLRKAIAFLRRIFLFRTCNKLPKSVCLNYYLKQCLAPCGGKADEKLYKEVVGQLVMFLEGRRPEVIKDMESRMEKAAMEKRYEDAARYRDQIRSLTQFVLPHRGRDEALNQIHFLKEVLNLKKEPKRIEAFDISNISGSEATGSMITFITGKPFKNGYRKFRIREVAGIDDYSMMREIVRRRYQRLLDEKESLPDLILIDGGRGHLSSVKDELDRIGMKEVPVISIAKEFEYIFLPDRTEPVKLPNNSPVLYLIQRIRDEAHRFAIGYHKMLRGKTVSISVLDEIKGIGPRKKAALMQHYGSIEGLKKAAKPELLNIKGISESLAAEILKKVK